MGPSTTDGKTDALASDPSSIASEAEAEAPAVARSRFLRALNFFPQEKTVAEMPPPPVVAPTPVVVIHDSDEDAKVADSRPRVEASVDGVVWRQGLMAMDGIELPEFEDLDSLPASGWGGGGNGVILSPWDGSWDANDGDRLANEQPAWNDPRQLWLNTENRLDVRDHRALFGASKDESPSELKLVTAAGIDPESESDEDKLATSESQSIMSNEGPKPSLETTAVPPAQETKLWTGLGQPGKQDSTESDADSMLIAADEEEWSDQSADVAFVAAVLEDVPAPESDPEAMLEEAQSEAQTASSRSAGVKLVPGWRPLRGGAGGDDGDFESSDEEEVASRFDADEEEKEESQIEAVGEGESEKKSKAGSRPIIRAPRHDSIVEGFGNFLNDSVVLDAAFTEPDFKALESEQIASPESDTELAADVVDDSETVSEGALELSDTDLEEVDVNVDAATESLDSVVAAPLSLSLEVVAPQEVDRDDVVPAAIVVPPLFDDEEDVSEIELSELGMAGLSVLGANHGEGEVPSLLENLAADETGDEEVKEGQAIDRFGALADDEEPCSSVEDSGFTPGNSALIRHGVRCPSCEQTLRIQNRYLGIEGRCPGCAEMIVAKCTVSGVVIAELAEVEAPKFFQQPSIEPGDVRGGTRLAAGGGQIADPEEEGDTTVEAEAEEASQAEGANEIIADEDDKVSVSEDSAISDCDPDDVASDAEGDGSTVDQDSPADPFSNPSRSVADESNDGDGIWGPGIGKSMS